MGSANVLQRILRPIRRRPTRAAPDVGHSDVTPPEHAEVQPIGAQHFDYEASLDEILALGLWKGASPRNNREILCRRFGLISGKAETLESIGADLGLSRERVRQIQQRALSGIRRHISSVDLHHSFVRIVEHEMAERGGAIGKEDVLKLIPHGEPFARYSRDMSVAFVLSFSPFVVKLPRNAEDRWIVYKSDAYRSQLETTANCIQAHLRANGPLQPDDLISVIASDEAEAATVRVSLAIDDMTTETEGYVWLAEPPKWHFHLTALRRLGKPAHFTEIARQVNRQLDSGHSMTERAVHATLGTHEPRVFRRVGLGTFGLAEWGLPIAKDSVDLVCQILEGELNWLTFQEITTKARALGWQAKPQSIKMALHLEDQKPTRRLRSIGSKASARYGLSWWNDP